MAINGTLSKAKLGTVTGDTDSGPASQFPFDETDYRMACQWRPRLYSQITQDHVSFDHIAQALWIGINPARPAGKEEQRVSLFLECLARRKFAKEHRGILKDYWTKRPQAGCALTGDGHVHSVMNITDKELVLYEDGVHQLGRDARRTFETAARHGDEKAEEDLQEVGEMLYSILARVILTASVLEDKNATPYERDEALASVRAAWKMTRACVEEMIQRQARFEYFEGVGLSALIAIPVFAAAGWAAVRYGANQFSEPNEPGSFAAAMTGGAAGAVISVTQRMTANTAFVLDFTAPKRYRVLLGMLRPLVGAVFGAVVYFAITGGLLAVHAATNKDSSVALAFFAIAGFAAGFSERFATDVLDRASSGIVPAAPDKHSAEKPDELALLLSEQSRHAVEPAGAQERQAVPPPRAAGENGQTDKTPPDGTPRRSRRRRHRLFRRSAERGRAGRRRSALHRSRSVRL